MPSHDELEARLVQLAEDGLRLLSSYDERLEHDIADHSTARAERQQAARMAKFLGEGSSEMRAIAGAVQEKLDGIEGNFDRTSNRVSTTKSVRHRLAKSVHWVQQALDPSDAPKAAEVRPLVWRLLRENNGLAYEDVYGLVRERLDEEGKGANGLGLRVREALTDPRVEQEADGRYVLAYDAVDPAAAPVTAKPKVSVLPTLSNGASDD